MKQKIQDYCNAHPELIGTCCGVCGNCPADDEGPSDMIGWEYSCGKDSNLPVCPYLMKFSKALEGKFVKYVSDKKTDWTKVGYVVNQTSNSVNIVDRPTDNHFDDFCNAVTIDLNDVLEVIEEKNYKKECCDDFGGCESCILKYCCTSSNLK